MFPLESSWYTHQQNLPTEHHAQTIWRNTFTTTQCHSFRLDSGCGRHPRFERHLSRGLQHTHRHCRRHVWRGRRWHIAHGGNGRPERTNERQWMKSRPAFWPAIKKEIQSFAYIDYSEFVCENTGVWCLAHSSTTVCKWWNIIWKQKISTAQTCSFLHAPKHNTKCFPLNFFKHVDISLQTQVEQLQN